MRILATVDFGKTHVAQAWELLDGNPSPFLKLIQLQNGKSLVIRLNRHEMIDLPGAEAAEKHYPGTLKVSGAIIVPSN